MYLELVKTSSLSSAPDIETDMQSLVRSLMTDFGSSPLANGRRMRELVRLDSDEFLRSAVALLRTETDRRGCRYLLTLLGTQDMLLPVLSDEKLPVDRALVAAQIAYEIDPQLHIRITRYLIATTLDQQSITEGEATKLLQILAAINDSTSLQPFVRQMLLHPSARIRSKLSLLIGRSQSGNRSLTTLLSDPDARVRANAVEALWHNASPDICAMVRGALDDVNNRVVGNAILGLYFAGHTSAITAAIKLTTHAEALFRATAAWAMGKTGDPRFLPLLGRMLADSTGQLRRTVFGSIGSIKQAKTARASAPPLRVAVLDVAESLEGKTRVRAAIIASNAAQTPDISATGFAIEADGTFVTDYSCSARSNEMVYLALALPYAARLGEEDSALLDDAVKSCLRTKRVPDQWTIAKYANDNHSTASLERTIPVTLLGQTMNANSSHRESSAKSSYTANLMDLTRAAEAKSSRFESDPSLQASLRALIAIAPSGNGAKHLFAIVPTPDAIDEETLEQMIQTAQAGHISIHMIGLHPSPEYSRLCRETQGFYREIDSFKNLGVELETLYACITKLYVLEFEDKATARADVNVLTLYVNITSVTGKGVWSRLGSTPEIQHTEVA